MGSCKKHLEKTNLQPALMLSGRQPEFGLQTFCWWFPVHQAEVCTRRPFQRKTACLFSPLSGPPCIQAESAILSNLALFILGAGGFAGLQPGKMTIKRGVRLEVVKLLTSLDEWKSSHDNSWELLSLVQSAISAVIHFLQGPGNFV